MAAITTCSWQMRLIINYFFNSLRSGFLGQRWSYSSLLSFVVSPLRLNLWVSPLNCWHIASCPPSACPRDSQICHYGVKSTNARILQIILLLTNLSKSCINDHKLKWAAKEVTSQSQFFQRKDKRIEDQKLNGLKRNLRILILNTSKFTNRGLFNFHFLPLTSKKIKTYFQNENWFFLSLRPTHLPMKK